MKPSPLKIALKGLGAAGKARLQALQENPHFKLAGIVSRRPETATLDWQQALADESIEAMAISTETPDHPASVQGALAAGKHVLCDYPLTWKPEEGVKLFNLAKKQQRILHVEHIGLLSSDHQMIKSEIQAKGKLIRGDYLFQGGWNEKIADPAWCGPYPLLALSRLLQVADWFGPFQVESRDYRADATGFFLHLHLSFPAGGILGFTEERRPGLPRRRSMTVQCSKGSLQWKPTLRPEGLFAKDLEYFYQRVTTGINCYYDETLMIQIIEELNKISP